MYVVTFYSFKGGVGRSMALANVAYELAQRGQRVLIVDFDLEAPGLNTFFSCTGDQRPGIVDYITSYLESCRAPEIADYLVECGVAHRSSSGNQEVKFWFMGAGKDDGNYGARLARIDWHRLYADEQGYLLLEHLKGQWKSHLTPDYVLIDSRTGYTDEGGICTRQLPDAVVCMFLLNEQNLKGMQKTVSDIRAEPSRSDPIGIHFVASNVTNLDDETGIIAELIGKFKHSLPADEIKVIHHYESADLNEQKIFTAVRARTKLAGEYRILTDAIAEENPRDRSGALSFLVGHTPHLSSSLSERSFKNLGGGAFWEKVAEITSWHANDPEILLAAARVWELRLRWHESLTLLRAAAELPPAKAEIFQRMAMILDQLNQQSEAKQAIRKAMQCPDFGFVELMIAAQKPSWRDALIDGLSQSGWRDRLTDSAKFALAHEMMSDTSLVGFAKDIHEDLSAKSYDRSRNELILCLIHLGYYHRAMDVIGDRDRLVRDGRVHDQFNYAMAEWASSSRVPKDLFEQVTEAAARNVISTRDQNANTDQCFSIAFWAIEESSSARRYVNAALEKLNNQPGRAFSAWSYLYVEPTRFKGDMSELHSMIEEGIGRPRFMVEPVRH